MENYFLSNLFLFMLSRKEVIQVYIMHVHIKLGLLICPRTMNFKTPALWWCRKRSLCLFWVQWIPSAVLVFNKSSLLVYSMVIGFFMVSIQSKHKKYVYWWVSPEHLGRTYTIKGYGRLLFLQYTRLERPESLKHL